MNNNFFPGNNFPTRDLNENMQDYNTNWFGNNDIYLENILKLNKGKNVKLYITIPYSNNYQDKIFEGIIEEIGKDHITISNPTTGEWSIILIPYITFITFPEKINT